MGLAQSLADGLQRAGPSIGYMNLFPDRSDFALLNSFEMVQERAGLVQRIEAPPLSTYWEKPAHWKVVLMGRWERDEHVNLLEARAALMARAPRSEAEMSLNAPPNLPMGVRAPLTITASCIGFLPGWWVIVRLVWRRLPPVAWLLVSWWGLEERYQRFSWGAMREA